MADQKKVAVTFYLKTDQDEDYLVTLAETIEARIEKMREGNPSLTAVKAAILISLELLDDYKKLEANYEEFRKEIETLKF